MEDMLETLVDIYTDAFYVVKDEYVEKLQKIRMEGKFEEFYDMESLNRSISDIMISPAERDKMFPAE